MVDERWQRKFNRAYVEFLQLGLLEKIRTWMGMSEREFASATGTTSHRFLNELKTGGQEKIYYRLARLTADFHAIPPWIIIAGDNRNHEILQMFKDEPSELPRAFDYDADSLLRELSRLTSRLKFNQDENTQISKTVDLIRKRMVSDGENASSMIEKLTRSVSEPQSHMAHDFALGRDVNSSIEPVLATFRYVSKTYKHNGRAGKWEAAWLALEGEIPTHDDSQVHSTVTAIKTILNPVDGWDVSIDLNGNRKIWLHSWFRTSKRSYRPECKDDIKEIVEYLLQHDPVLTMHFQPLISYDDQLDAIDPKLIDLISRNSVSEAWTNFHLSKPAVIVLLECGYLKVGDRLVMKFGRSSKSFSDSDPRFYGTFQLTPDPAIRWDVDMKEYFMTTLTMEIMKDSGRLSPESKTRVDGYTCWGLEGCTTSLYDAAKIIARGIR